MYAIVKNTDGTYYTSVVFGYFCKITSTDKHDIVPFAAHLLCIEIEVFFLTGAVIVVQDTEPLIGVERHAPRTECGKPRGQVRFGAVEIGSSLIDISFADRYGDILLHLIPAASGSALAQKIVEFPAVLVERVQFVWHQDILLDLGLHDASAVDGDLGGGGVVKAVEQFGILFKDRPLVLLACHIEVDVREAVALGILAARIEDTVIPYLLDGDDALNRPRYTVLDLFLCGMIADRLTHGFCTPPFPFP